MVLGHFIRSMTAPKGLVFNKHLTVGDSGVLMTLFFDTSLEQAVNCSLTTGGTIIQGRSARYIITKYVKCRL